MSLAANIVIFNSDDSSSVAHATSCLMSSIWARFSCSSLYEYVTKQEALDALRLALSPEGSCDAAIIGQIFKSFVDRGYLSVDKDDRYKITDNASAISSQKNIQGVIVPLSGCYAPRCSKDIPCYSSTCPNKENPGQLQLVPYDNNMLPSIPNGVSRSIFLGLETKERKRQNAIAEILASEQQYYQDLDILHTIYAEPLLSDSSVIEQARRIKFHRTVFGNYRIIRHLHHQGYKELLEKQNRASHLFGDHVGTAIYNHVSRLMDAYVTYAANHVQAAYVITFESNKSPRFEEFLEKQHTNESTRRLGLQHYLTLPTLRIGKYTLLVQALYKYATDEGDQLTLGAAIAELRDILERMNEATRQSEIQAHRLRIASTLLIPGHVSTTLENILPDQATLLYEGRMLLARSLHSFTTIPCHVLLFTHLVVVTRPRVSGKHEEFEVACAPIPLHMLCVDVPQVYNSSLNGASRMSLTHRRRPEKQTITGLHIRSRLLHFRQSLRYRKVAVQQEQQQHHKQNHVHTLLRRNTGSYRLNSSLRILILRHLGRADCTFHLACSNTEERDKWYEHLRTAMENVKVNNGPFGLSPLCEVATGSGRPSIIMRRCAMYPTGCGRIWCTLAFGQAGRRAMLALGTQFGVWVGPRDGGSQDFWLAVAHDDCQQLAILDNVVLLVRNRRGALMAYDLEQVCQPHSVGGHPHRWGFICRSSVVSFAVGAIHNSPVVAYLTDGRNSDTIVVLEYRAEWFRKLKEHRLESRDACHLEIVHNIIFVQSPTMGVCRVEGSKYLWKTTCPDMLGFVPFTSETGFAYSSQAAWWISFRSTLWTDNVQSKIQFESILQRAAIVYPYLIGFSPSVIEVRDMRSGRTAQVLTGNRIRCVHVSHGDKEHPTIHVSILHHEEHVTRVYSLLPQYCT